VLKVTPGPVTVLAKTIMTSLALLVEKGVTEHDATPQEFEPVPSIARLGKV
jgi:hypothetical protein